MNTNAYDYLGGMDGVNKLVDEFVAVMKADKRIHLVAPPELVAKHAYDGWKQILTSIAKGDVLPVDIDVAKIHGQMPISANHFNAVMDDLSQATKKLGVPNEIQQMFLSRLKSYESCLVKRA